MYNQESETKLVFGTRREIWGYQVRIELIDNEL